MKTPIGFTAFGFTLALPNFAFAHAGHVGELAGHSHWIAMGALAGAAAIAAVIASKSRKKQEQGAEDASTESSDTETEAA